MTKEEQMELIAAFAAEDYARGYKQGRQDEREHVLHLIEEGVWRDVDMLVEQIKERNHDETRI